LTDEIPIRRLWKNRERLGVALDESQWDESKALADLIVDDIRLALDPSKSIVLPPTLDGVYTVGTVRYERAPDKIKRTLNKMNRILRTAKMNIPRKRK